MNYWNQKNIPHKGWQNVGFEDLLEPTHKCEMCGRDEIRYVHTMYHPNVEKHFRVGQVCADHMSNDYTKAREQLTYMKNRTIWITDKWHTPFSDPTDHLSIYQYEEKSTNVYNARCKAFVFLFNNEYVTGIDKFIFSKSSKTKREAKTFLYDIIQKSKHTSKTVK